MYSYGLPLRSLSFRLSMGLLRQKVVRLLAVLVAMYSATFVGLSELNVRIETLVVGSHSYSQYWRKRLGESAYDEMVICK